MKYKAKYSAESDIPADVKAFYVLKDGEWVFNGTDFEGLDALLNPGLAANRDALKVEKDTVKNERDAAVKERDTAVADLAKASKPGTIFMDAAEKSTLDEYKALGTPKDIKEKLDNEKVASEKLGLLGQEGDIRNLAKATGLNEDALVDFKLNSERGKTLTLGSVKKKVKNEKGVEEEKLVPVIKITDNVNGKEVVTDKDFFEYAKENNFPEYLVTALSNGSASQVDTKAKPEKKFTAPPSMGSKTTGEEEGSRANVNTFIKKSNESRSTRQMPWSKKSETTET